MTVTISRLYDRYSDAQNAVRSLEAAGVPPEIMGMGPVPATLKALARAGQTIDDILALEA